MSEIKIVSKEKISDSITAFEVESPFPFPKETRFGIDPGTTNLGIAVVRPEMPVQLYKITLKRHKKALKRILAVQKVLAYAIGYFDPNSKAIIEGASFGAVYRQVELAEIRAGMLLWFHRVGIEVDLVPPKAIRKQVFGSGNVINPWKNLDDNLAAALGCAFYSVSNSDISSAVISTMGE